MNRNIYKSGLIVLLCLQLLLIPLTLICSDRISGILFLALIGLCLPCVILSILCLYWSGRSASHSGKTLGIVSLFVEAPLLALSAFSIFTADESPTAGALLLLFAELLLPLIVIFLLQKRVRFSGTPSPSDSRPLPRISRKSVALGAAVLAIIAAFLIFIPGKNERATISSAQHLQSILKDPASLTLRGDIYVFSSNDSPLVLIHYSARNGFGGTNSDYAFFDEYGYLGSSESSVDGLSATRKERYADARLYMSLCGTAGISPGGSKSVSGQRVASRIGCSYSAY